jgi:hypothetical protein
MIAVTLMTAAACAFLIAAPSVFPTGVTIYDPAKTWNGYTVLSPLAGTTAIVIDMNGKVVKTWDGYSSSAGGPNRILPNGIIIGATGTNGGKQESTAMVQRDFEGKELWRFDHNEQIPAPAAPGDAAAKGKGPGPGQAKGKGKGASPAGNAPAANGPMIWSSRQHHDWQREDFPGGYYSPSATPAAQPANMLVLTHRDLTQPKVASGTLEDDRLIEVAPDGKILWEWTASDHVDEMKFDEAARKSLAAGGGGAGRGGGYNWLHINAATYLGPNHWFDEGDKRFDPKNVIFSSREASVVGIIARDGKIVWQLGPDYNASPEMQAIRQVIGQHHTHMIPKGLPGAGNIMIFDNGGPSGYGPPSSTAPKGKGVWARASSRILEIDPVSLKLVWSYTVGTFYASNISGAQRLQNGNTLITEGPSGRIFEVTTGGDIVWEYIHPPSATPAKGGKVAATASVYRAFRLPYSWIPQLQAPKEQAVKAPANGEFRVP